MREPDRLSYLVAAHVLMATPDVQLSDVPAARRVASVLGSVVKRLRRLELRPTDKLVPPKAGTPEHKAWSAVHREPPGPQRQANRSRTFPGVAAAIAEQWGGYVMEGRGAGGALPELWAAIAAGAA